MSAILNRDRTLQGRDNRIAVMTVGDSYMMCQQKGSTSATVNIVTPLANPDGSGSTTPGNPIIQLYNMPAGLTSGTGGSSVVLGPVESHSGFTSTGALFDALTGAGVSGSILDMYEYAWAGSQASSTAAANAWGINVPTSANTTNWAAGTLLGTNTLWTNTYGANHGLGLLDALKSVRHDIVVVMTLGGNDVFAGGATNPLLAVDSYGRPGAFRSDLWDSVIGVNIYNDVTKIVNFMHQLVALNPHHPALEVHIPGYLNFPMDELATNTPVVDLPHGSATGGAGYTGTAHTTDHTIDRKDFYGSSETNPSFPFNTQDTAYTKAHDLGTGRFDPEFYSPYHDPTNSPQYDIYSQLFSAATGGRGPVPITTVGMVKALTTANYNNATWAATWTLGTTFYNRWWGHYTVDTAFKDWNRDVGGSWASQYTNAQGLAGSNFPLWVAVSTLMATNDSVGRAFKGMLGPIHTTIASDQVALGRKVFYIPTWDVLTPTRGLGSSTYYSAGIDSFCEGTHPNSTANPTYATAIATGLLANTALL